MDGLFCVFLKNLLGAVETIVCCFKLSYVGKKLFKFGDFMSISRKLLLVSLLVTGSFYVSAEQKSVTLPAQVHHHTTVYTKPETTTKKLINWIPTENEKKLADAKAEQELKDLNKPSFQKFGEDLQNNMTYLYNAKPFDVEHGFVKGAGVVAAVIILYNLYQYFQNDASKSE